LASPPVTSSSGDNRQSHGTQSSPLDLEHTPTVASKQVPPNRADRDEIRKTCRRMVTRFDRSRPLSRSDLVTVGQQILEENQLNPNFLGWTMVILASEFWRDQISTVPVDQRVLLLPHCLKHAEACPASYDQHGLSCRSCGACSIGDLGQLARQRGYRVLVAEGSPVVLQIILNGQANAILGVACLNVLEKVVDNILLTGIPCAAVPLLSSDCRDSEVDTDWVREMISLPFRPEERPTRTYIHLMRAAVNLFADDSLQQLAPRRRQATGTGSLGEDSLDSIDPIAGTEALAYEFLTRGGKYSRPFITLAAYDALTGERGTARDGAEWLAQLPPSVQRTAMSIEAFHKASLVHDDIEDDDAYRYGQPTLHRQYGVATAINVGDYLIGMGYRLVGRETSSLGADAAADILGCLAEAHTQLSEGQGAELIWRDSRQGQLQPIDALKIYALKTAPAFEAALLAGIRLATTWDDYIHPIKRFARDLGIAFQILNDLKDWQSDQHNKLATGADVLGRRPTVLWALAWDALDDAGHQQLLELQQDESLSEDFRTARVRQIYYQAGVFEKARRLVSKYRVRATEVANHIQPISFRRLTQFLIDSVLSDA
jgi:geranylgeranyl pyrophosphate synthase